MTSRSPDVSFTFEPCLINIDLHLMALILISGVVKGQRLDKATAIPISVSGSSSRKASHTGTRRRERILLSELLTITIMRPREEHEPHRHEQTVSSIPGHIKASGWPVSPVGLPHYLLNNSTTEACSEERPQGLGSKSKSSPRHCTTESSLTPQMFTFEKAFAGDSDRLYSPMALNSIDLP